MLSEPSMPVLTTLKLPEAVDALMAYYGCTQEHARGLLERAIFDRTLRDITTLYPDGTELTTDVTAWREIDWDTGTVTLEPSWSGSPPTLLPVIPFLDREQFLESFGIGLPHDRRTGKKSGGRPIQHDWDAFWIEVCRRVHECDLPSTRKELADGMMDWFMERGDESIDERTVAKKISSLYEVLRRD